MTKIKIKKQKAIAGFLPTTYAVFDGEKLLKITLSKKDAENFVDSVKQECKSN